MLVHMHWLFFVYSALICMKKIGCLLYIPFLTILQYNWQVLEQSKQSIVVNVADISLVKSNTVAYSCNGFLGRWK